MCRVAYIWFDWIYVDMLKDLIGTNMHITESKLRSIIKIILKEQNATECLTSGANFNTQISPRRVSVSVDMPFDLNLDEEEAIKLEALLHNAVELVLSRYF